jgi:hypothetical protein
MPPEQRFLPRFAAEPPQEQLPYGRWAERLREEFLAAALGIDDEAEDLGEPGELIWYPDRSWHGRTYVPGTSTTSNGYELFGYVRFLSAGAEEEPSDFWAHVDFTEETAERNPDSMTLVWGHPLVPGGRIVTAELAGLAVDQCELMDERFTLIAPDDYRHDLLEIRLFGSKNQELASESLYAAAEEEEEEEEEEAAAE